MHLFCGKGARKNGVVRALDPRNVDEPRGAADQKPAGEGELGQGLKPAFRQGARAVGDPLAVLQHGANRRVELKALHFLIRREIRVLIVQPHDKADRQSVLIQMIQKRAAIGFVIQGPADRVQHSAFFVMFRLDLPEFLNPEPVGLRIAALAQIVFFNDLFG